MQCSEYLIDVPDRQAAADGDLRNEIRVLSKKIDRLLDDQAALPADNMAGAVALDDMATRARAEYRRRRSRQAAFGGFNFDREAAWDILLDLLATHDGGPIHTTSACIGSNVPQTTALRHINLLEKAGLVVSEACSRDRRVRRIRLSEQAQEGFGRYFAAGGASK